MMAEVFDIHDYDSDPESLKKRWDEFSALKKAGEKIDRESKLIKENEVPFHYSEYDGSQPVFISEFGGIRWNADSSEGWGYGNAPKTEEEFVARFRGLCEAIMGNGDICGFCYTQLYDVEQEVNGLYTYGRAPKFDVSIFRKILSKKAKIEE